MKGALLIIDVQNDYFPGGKCELYRPNEALEVVKELIGRFRKDGMPVIYVKHSSMNPAAMMAENTVGADIHPEILPHKEDVVITKLTPNSFYGTKLNEVLHKEGITDLNVCGMMSHMCIDTTVRAAKYQGYNVTVFKDACTTKDLTWENTTIPAATVHNTYMASLNGVFATVVSAKEYIV